MEFFRASVEASFWGENEGKILNDIFLHRDSAPSTFPLLAFPLPPPPSSRSIKLLEPLGGGCLNSQTIPTSALICPSLTNSMGKNRTVGVSIFLNLASHLYHHSKCLKVSLFHFCLVTYGIRWGILAGGLDFTWKIRGGFPEEGMFKLGQG